MPSTTTQSYNANIHALKQYLLPEALRSLLLTQFPANMLHMKNIIFDFDGTIANSLLALAEIIEKLAPIYHFQAITPDILPQLRTMPAQQILTYLKIKPWLVPILMIVVRYQLQKKIPQMTLQPGLDSLFKRLTKHTANIGILSSNSKKNIEQFLSQHPINPIKYIHVEKYRLSKHRALRSLLRKHNFQTSNTCYVVDEMRDIEAAQALGITSIAVTWGYNTSEALAAAKPDFLVHTPEALEKILLSKA
ncbi:MAG: HAD hydrolase-like protein [Legionellaceae bacterium]|nr:HAD hydrolase-like protein [Legionellaceae bacterium]